VQHHACTVLCVVFRVGVPPVSILVLLLEQTTPPSQGSVSSILEPGLQPHHLLLPHCEADAPPTELVGFVVAKEVLEECFI